MKKPDLIVKVNLLTEKEGGRRTSFFNGYRGQFYYDNLDWDATYDIIGNEEAMPGEEVELELSTASKEIHFGKFDVGTKVKIREGNRIIANGEVLRILNPQFEEWDLEKFKLTTAKSLKPYSGDLIQGYVKFFNFYLKNEKLFSKIEIIEPINSIEILRIRLEKKESALPMEIHKFIINQWSEQLTLGNDRLRIDYKLDESRRIQKIIVQFATWVIDDNYMSGKIIVV